MYIFILIPNCYAPYDDRPLNATLSNALQEKAFV